MCVYVKQLAKDLLNPSLDFERRQHKKKRLVQSPNSYFMDVKCPGILHLRKHPTCHGMVGLNDCTRTIMNTEDIHIHCYLVLNRFGSGLLYSPLLKQVNVQCIYSRLLMRKKPWITELPYMYLTSKLMNMRFKSVLHFLSVCRLL